MNIFTKQQIINLINENFHSMDMDMDEMARARSGESERLPEPMYIDFPGVATKDPKTGEIVQDKIISDDVIILPNGKKVLMFADYNRLKPDGKNTFFGFYDYEEKKYYKAKPRNVNYDSSYVPTYDKETGKQVTLQPETVAKKMTFATIQKFFKEGQLYNHLLKCAIPEIVGSAYFTEPVTNVQKIFTFGGESSNIKFNLHSVKDHDDIQSAIDKVLEIRMALGSGEEVKGDLPKKMVRKHAGQIYVNGEWKPDQRTASEKHHDLTKIYRLHKKAVQGGTVSFTVQSDLTVIGGLNGTDYTLALNFSVTKYLREATKSRGMQKGQVIEPIRVHVNEQIPEGVNPEELSVANNKEFFGNLYFKALQQLGEEILAIDPDDALTQLMFDPSDVDSDFENDY
jgi:hypothetical protein